MSTKAIREAWQTAPAITGEEKQALSRNAAAAFDVLSIAKDAP